MPIQHFSSLNGLIDDKFTSNNHKSAWCIQTPLNTGDQDINNFLGPSLDDPSRQSFLPSLGITEISGDPGSGKTQLW